MPSVFLAYSGQLVAQSGVGGDATCDGHLVDAVCESCFFEFFQKESDNAVLDRGTEVGFVVFDEVGIFLESVAKEVEERGLDAAETVVVARDIRSGEVECFGVAVFGEFVYDRSSGVSEVHDFGGFVDGFACGVVDGVAYDLKVEMASQKQDLRVSTTDEEAHERELRELLSLYLPRDEVREHMSLKMVDFNERDVESLSKTFCKRDANQERTQQSGPASESHRIEVAFVNTGIADGSIDGRDDILLMGSRGEFGDNATELAVYGLRCDNVG